MSELSIHRCHWAGSDPLMIRYHDEEWGIPTHDDRALFERLVLESFQAGLSWNTILQKRENFRRAFDNFDLQRIIQYTPSDVESLMSNEGIIRNRRKIESTINNAKRFIAIQEAFGSFDRYIWGFTDGAVLQNPIPPTRETIPTHTAISDVLSKDLQRRGFKFVGSVICYAYMQSIGMSMITLLTVLNTIPPDDLPYHGLPLFQTA